MGGWIKICHLVLAVLQKPEVVLTAKRYGIITDRSTPYIVLKSNRKSGIREFVYAVSAIFLLPVWTEMAIGPVA